MLSAYTHTDGPNQTRDVFVHFTERDISRGDFVTVWTVYRGHDQEAEFTDQFEALRFARTLADEHQLPVWKMGREWEGLVRLGE